MNTSKSEKLSSSPGRWVLLIACLAALIGLHIWLIKSMPGLESAEASYCFELVPGVSPLTKPALETSHKDHPEVHRTAMPGFLAATAALYAAYAITLGFLARGGSSKRLERFVFASGLLLMGVQVASPVLLSTDVLAYAEHGRVVAFHGNDPSVDTHPLPANDPFLVLMGGRYSIWPYGPLWTLVSGAAAKAGGEHVGLTILLFRLVAAVSIVGASAVLWRTLRKRAPLLAAMGLAFFFWNPLVTVESAGGAHLDAMMVGLLVLAFAWQGTGRSGLTMVALALSALVKYATIVLVPLFLIAELLPTMTPRERRVRAIRCVLGLFLPAILTFGLQRSLIVHPSGQSGFGSLLMLTVGQEYTNSWHELSYPALRQLFGEPPEIAELPDSFAGWWLAPKLNTALRSGPSEASKESFPVSNDTPLLVVGVSAEDWLLVRGREGKIGYLARDQSRSIDRPEWVDADPDFSVWEWSPNSTQEARKAGRVLRGVTLGVFGLIWLVALANVARGSGLAKNASVLLLAVCYFLGGWFWPWYALWPLASVAFIPKSRLAWLSVLLSAGVLTLYATINGPPELERFRSLFAFGLPLVLFAATFRIVGKPNS